MLGSRSEVFILGIGNNWISLGGLEISMFEDL